MNSFDSYCNELLEQSKRFNEKSKIEKNPDGIKAYRNSSLLLAICALEAFVNGISEEITIATNFPMHSKGILLEKEVRLEKSNWTLTNTPKISRLVDKIELLFHRHKRAELSITETWWPILKEGIDFRNKTTHPKESIAIPEGFNNKIIQSVLECLSTLYKAIYKRDFPKSQLSLVSRLEF